MNNETKPSPNAGAQTDQAWSEWLRFRDMPDDTLITLKAVSIVLEINRNSVNQIPVPYRLIEKRKYFRKGDIARWAELESQHPQGILARLRGEQARATAKILKHPSRGYQGGKIDEDEARKAKEKTKENVGMPFSIDEKARGLHRRRAPARDKPTPQDGNPASAVPGGWELIRKMLGST